MRARLQRLVRIALFAALIYVLSLASATLPGITPAYFIAWLAGFLWGSLAGFTTGALGMALWTFLNPYGPALPPVALAQIIGMGGCGLVGTISRMWLRDQHPPIAQAGGMGLTALLASVVFFVPVVVVDAWFHQPFWPRIVAGSTFTLIPTGANVILFVLLLPVVWRVRRFESQREPSSS